MHAPYAGSIHTDCTPTQWQHGMGNQHNRQALIMMLIFFWSTFPILCLLFIACFKAHILQLNENSHTQIFVCTKVALICQLHCLNAKSWSLNEANCHSTCALHTHIVLLTLLCEDVYLIFHTMQYCTAIIRIQKSLHEVMRRLHGTLWCDYVHKAIIAWSINACMVVMWRSVK